MSDEISQAEILRAKRWRKDRGFTLEQLSELIGYSVSSIFWFEKGLSPPGADGRNRPVNPYAWQRYKLCCKAAMDKREFNW